MSSLPPKVIKQGKLAKRGVYFKNWRDRYFQLLDNGILHGYKNGFPETPGAPGDDNALNEFPVANCKVKLADDIKKHAFVIIFLSQTTFIERIFKCSSDAERMEWVTAIQSLATKRNQSHVETDREGSPAANDDTEMCESISLSDFEIVSVLGKGTFGKVVLAKRHDEDEYVAIKLLKKEVIMEKDEITHTITENRVLKKVKHPFLTELKYSFQTPDRLCFVMEFVNGGELFYHLSKDRLFTVDRARFYGAEILLALGYLHEHGIIYRDLKLENLLLDSEGHIKIADFGLCKEHIDFETTTQTFCGTPEYLAPEVLEENDYTRAVDWWGLGVVMYEMLCGQLPFYHRDHETLFELIIHEEITYVNHVKAIPDAVEMLSGLLCKAPKQRLGASKRDVEEIKEHPFFAVLDFDDVYNKRLTPPFKPELTSATDVSYFDTDFTRETTNLSPTDSSALDDTANEVFSEFSYISSN